MHDVANPPGPDVSPRRVLLCLPGSYPRSVADACAWLQSTSHVEIDEVHVVVSEAHVGPVSRALLGTPRGAGLLARIPGLPAPYLTQRTIHALPELTPADAAADFATGTDRLWRLVAALTRDSHSCLYALTTPAAGAYGALLHTMLQWAGPAPAHLLYADPEVRDRRRGVALHVTVPLVEQTDGPRESERFTGFIHRRTQESRQLRNPEPVYLQPRNRTFAVVDTRVVLPPALMFWYTFFALTTGRRFNPSLVNDVLRNGDDGRIAVCAAGAPAETHATLAALRSAHYAVYNGQQPNTFALTLWRACGPTPLLPSIVSKLNARLAQALGRAATPYCVTGRAHGTGYGLALSAERICITGPLAAPRSSPAAGNVAGGLGGDIDLVDLDRRG